MKKYYLAIDIGASSGRHIMGHIEEGKMILEEVFRFDNRQLEKNGHVVWDIENLWTGILGGLKECRKRNMIPEYIGIDTWAVDFVLLDKNGKMIGDAVAYRDPRTNGMDKKVYEHVSEIELYTKTGIQKQPFNTVYQFMALKEESPEELESAEYMLMIPDYLNYLLTGETRQEYTNATTTNLVNAATKTWDESLIFQLSLPRKLFGPLSMPGTVVGQLSPEIIREVGFTSTVVLPATHDTGSAFLSVPAKDEDSVFLSSGTWSLLGVENMYPITSSHARECNLTNEGGAWYRFRFLKNIMGLWMIQSIRRELNGTEYIEGRKSRYAGEKYWGFEDLIEETKKYSDFISTVDANDDRFLAPESMIDEIKKACEESGQAVPEEVGEIMNCVYLSLAKCYKDAIREISEVTEKEYTSLNIIGGGCQDRYLNEMTAKMTGLPVYAGPIEGTAIGNLIVQMITAGEFKDLSEARKCVGKSFDIEKY